MNTDGATPGADAAEGFLAQMRKLKLIPKTAAQYVAARKAIGAQNRVAHMLQVHDITMSKRENDRAAFGQEAMICIAVLRAAAEGRLVLK